MLTACGETNNTGKPKASEETQETAVTKTITTVNGEVTIPIHPKRIVAVEYIGSLIALDIIPVGAPGLTLKNYYFKDALTGIDDIGDYSAPSTESVLALSPDLIITGNGDNYEALSKIALQLLCHMVN